MANLLTSVIIAALAYHVHIKFYDKNMELRDYPVTDVGFPTLEECKAAIKVVGPQLLKEDSTPFILYCRIEGEQT